MAREIVGGGEAKVKRRKRSRSCMRNSVAVVAVGALAADTVPIPATPANTVDTITAADQVYSSYYEFDRVHAKGYTDEGVTIAMIDGRVNTSVPELVGVNITMKTPCTINSSPALETHGTGAASIPVFVDYGVAPRVSLLAYQGTFGADDDQSSSDCDDPSSATKDSQSWLLNQAMNDGVQVISVSASTPNEYKELKWATARAIA